MAQSKSRPSKQSKVVKPKRDTRRSTESHRNHRFQGFSERISRLKIDPIRRRRNAEEREELADHHGTYFGRAMADWRDTNMSQTFTSFAKAAAPLCETLPAVLHNEDTIMGILMEYIERKDALAMEALLDLLAKLAHDLDTRFERHFGQAVSTVARVAADHADPAVVEWSFTCLAWLFKYLSRLLAPDLRPVYDLMSPYLGKASQKPFIIRFAAESMSFLMRRTAVTSGRDGKPLELIIRHILQDCASDPDIVPTDLHRQGVMTLLTEAIKGIQGDIHSTGIPIVRALLRDARLHPSESSSSMLNGILTSLIHFTNSDTFRPLLDLVLDEHKDLAIDATDDNVLLATENLLVMVSVRKGTRIAAWPEVFQFISMLIANGCHVNAWSTKTRSVILSSFAIALQIAPVQSCLPVVQSLGKLRLEAWAPHFLQFCDLFARLGNERFVSFVLPQLQEYVLQNGANTIDRLLEVLPHLLRHNKGSKIRCSLELQSVVINRLRTLAHASNDGDHEHHLPSCCSILEALPNLTLAEKNAAQVRELLLDIIQRALRMTSQSSTPLIDFSLGICLQRWLELADQSDVVEGLYSQMGDLSAHQVTHPLFWLNIRTMLQELAKTNIIPKPSVPLEESLISALSSSSHHIREYALDIIQMLFQGQAQQISDALSAAILIESLPASLETSRTISMNVRRLAAGYPEIATDKFMSRAIPTYCFGLLHFHLAQAWTDALDALSLISKVPAGEEVIVSIAQAWLEANPDPVGTDLTSPQLLDGDSAGYQVLSDFECSNFAKLHAIASQVFEEPNSGYLTADGQLEVSTQRIPVASANDRGQALRVLDKVPQVAEKRSRLLVPVLLSWAGNSSEQANGTVNSGPRWSRKDQKSMLGIFAQFVNPKVLFKSEEVYQALLNLCTNGDVEIQRAALKAVFAWKDQALLRYEEHLRNLLDDARFREEISIYLQSDTDDGLLASDSSSVMPVLLRLLYGRLVGGAKETQHARRKAVFVALSRFDERVLGQFIDIALSSIRTANSQGESTEVGSSTNLGTPLRQQLGALNMVSDLLETIGSALMPFAGLLLDSVLHCTVNASIRLRSSIDDSAEKVDDVSLLRSVRQTGIQGLAMLFGKLPDLDVEMPCKIIAEQLFTPRLENFAAENSQGVSSILRLLSAWTSSSFYRRYLWEFDARILFSIADLLRFSGAKDEVRLFVLKEIVDNLLADEVSDSLPEDSVSAFVEGIGHVLKSQPSKEVMDTCVRTVTGLASRLTDVGQARSILSICSELLTQPSRIVSAGTKLGLLRTTIPLLDIAESSEEPRLYGALCGLFSRISDLRGREILSAAFYKLCTPSAELSAVAEVCRGINAVHISRLGEPDHARREQAFLQCYTLADEWTEDQWSPVLHNLIFFVRDENDTVNRSSAAKGLELFISVARKSGPVTGLLRTDLFPAIQRGMKARSELVRVEYLNLLGKIVQDYGDWTEVSDLTSLIVGGDDEASFFTNVLHIQQHRRLRALRRLADDHQVRSNNITRIILPLLEHFIFDQAEGDAGRTLADQTVQTIGQLAKRLRWPDFRSTLLRYYTFLKTKQDLEKTVLRIIGALIDGLNPFVPRREGPHALEIETMVLKPSEPANAETNNANAVPQNRVKVITNEFLPPLLEYLRRKDDSTVDRRVGVAISVVKLLRMLPEDDFVQRLAPILTDISHILKSRDLEAREQTRRTLSTILSLIGPSYLSFIVKELRSALQRGYQMHVLSYTVHHLLVTNGPTFDVGDVDACLPELVAIVMDDVFGVTGQEKDAEEYKTGMKEIKNSKSQDTMEILARMTTIGRLGGLIMPVRALLSEKLDAKTVKKIDDLLIRVRRGIDQSPAANSRDILIFCHEIVRQVYAQKHELPASDGIESWKLKKYLSQSKGRNANGVKGATTSYTFKLTAFALNLVRHAVRRHEDLQTPANMGGFLPMLGDGLLAAEEEVKIEAARLLSTIIRVEIPELSANSPVYLKEAIAMVKGSPSTTTDSARAGLELVTAILREQRTIEVKENDIASLLKLLKQDLDQPDRQGMIFRFLRAVLGRKIVITEVYEVFDDVARIMINNSDETVRQSARAAYVQFVMDFPQGKDRWAKTTGFLVSNLQFEHAGGRRSLLETIHTLLGRLGDEVVQQILPPLFLGLVPRTVSDADTACRDMALLLIGRLLERADEGNLVHMKEMMSKWLQNQKKSAVRQAALVCWTICVKADKAREKDIDMLLKVMTDLVSSDEVLEGADTVGLICAVLRLFTELCERKVRPVFAPAAEQFWTQIHLLVTAESVEVQILATKLVGLLYSSIASNSSNIATGLSATRLEATGGLLISADELRRNCNSHLRALRIMRQRSDVVAANIVRNLVHLGRIFAEAELEWSFDNNAAEQNEEQALEDDIDAVDQDQVRDTTALGRLLARLASILRSEKAILLARTAALQAAAVLLNVISLPSLSLPALIRPLYVLTDPSIPQPPGEEHQALSDKARGLLDQVQKKVGPETYLKMLGEARKAVNETRDERRRKRRVDAVSQPERWARDKRRRYEMKKARSRVKAEQGRGMRRGW